MGSVGFWIFIAAVVVANTWSQARQRAEKHETLRRIVEKTGTLDEAKLKELFRAAPAVERKPGSGYRALRVAGTVILFIGAGIATFFLIGATLGKLFGPEEMFRNITGLIAGLSVGAAIAMLGLGVFFSSRFAEPPPGLRNDQSAR